MKQLKDTVWQRRGISWLWEANALAMVGQANEVWTLRQLLRAADGWPEDLPSNDGNTLIVAGLEGTLDLLAPDAAEGWLEEQIKDAILSFQSFYEGQAALVFWLPGGAGRLQVHPATDAVQWRCAPPFSPTMLEFGRILWGEAREYPQEIILTEGGKAAGLFHLRIT
jgi:hypothetical protein